MSSSYFSGLYIPGGGEKSDHHTLLKCIDNVHAKNKSSFPRTICSHSILLYHFGSQAKALIILYCFSNEKEI